MLKFEDSTELLDFALRELQVAINHSNPKVEIVLDQEFSGGLNEMQEIGNKLEIRIITEIFREHFVDYKIKSDLSLKNLSMVITFERGSCSLYYPLVWTLILQKKS